MKQSKVAIDIALFVLALPALVIRALFRGRRRLLLAELAVAGAAACRTCGHRIPLVGFWRCRCGYTYQGHLLRYCPVCGSFPHMVRCYRCGATESVPQWT
jgi:hypothetical protein